MMVKPMAINEYMQNRLNRSKDALDMEMLDECVHDAELATDLGINSDEEYLAFHYIDCFVDDIAEQATGVRLPEADEKILKAWVYQHREDFDLSELEGFYKAVLAWMESHKAVNKKAYPNDSYIRPRLDRGHIALWAELAKAIQKRIVKGEDRRSAILTVSSSLDAEQRYDFMVWYNAKFGQDSNKYDLNRRIMELSEGLMDTQKKNLKRKVALQYDGDSRSYYVPRLNSPVPDASQEIRILEPDDVVKRERDRESLEFARAKLVSRTFAIDKMLEKYKDVISDVQFADIEDSLNMLRKKIRSLKYASSVEDCLIKTAKRVKRAGFDAGEIALKEIGARYIGDLNERGPFVKKALDQLAPMINDLQVIDAELKRRDIARAISKIDFQLAEMNLAGLFTELSEAQSRLIDAYTYASNKVKEVIPKMRSTQPGTTDRPGGDTMRNIRTPNLAPLQSPGQSFQTTPGAAPQIAPNPATAPTTAPQTAPPKAPAQPSAVNKLQQGLI